MRPQPPPFSRPNFNTRRHASCILRIIDTSRHPIETAFTEPGPTDQYYWVHEGVLSAASGLFREVFERRGGVRKRGWDQFDESATSSSDPAMQNGDDDEGLRTQTAGNGILYRWQAIRAGCTASDPPVIEGCPGESSQRSNVDGARTTEASPVEAEPRPAAMSIVMLTSQTPTPTPTPAPSGPYFRCEHKHAAGVPFPSSHSATPTATRPVTSLNRTVARTPESPRTRLTQVKGAWVPLLTVCLPNTAMFPETLYWMYSGDDARLGRAVRQLEWECRSSACGDGVDTSLMDMFDYLGIQATFGGGKAELIRRQRLQMESDVYDVPGFWRGRKILDVNGMDCSLGNSVKVPAMLRYRQSEGSTF